VRVGVQGDSPLPEREVSSLHPCCPPPADFAGECDSVAKRRHSQDRGKPCPYYTTARQARPSYSRGIPCGYPGTLPTVIRQQSPLAAKREFATALICQVLRRNQGIKRVIIGDIAVEWR